MKINLVVVNECGEELIAEVLDSNAIVLLGDQVDDFVEFKLAKLRDRYPEARYIYREDEQTLAEQRCSEYDMRYQENLKWAEERPDEIDDMDPEEWADETTREEMDNEWW